MNPAHPTGPINGVPVRIVRDGADETVHLSTRRSGDAGAGMRSAHRQIEECAARALQIQAELTALAALAEKPDTDLAKLTATNTRLIGELQELRAQQRDARETLIRLSLAANYGADEAARILDCFTLRDIEAACIAWETGDQPEGFFAGRRHATQHGESGTSPATDSHGAHSSPPDTTATTSTPDASPSRTDSC